MGEALRRVFWFWGGIVAGVAARCGDAPPVPPFRQAKSLIAAPDRVFKQARTRFLAAPVNERIRIRPFRSDDAVPPITALLHSAYASLASMGFRYLATHQDDATTLRRLEQGFGFVAELEGVTVGTITLRATASQSDCAWYVRPGVFTFGQFAVRPDLQRCGIGLRMIQFIEQQARDRGAMELALDTAEGARHLRQWYERLGFRFIQHVSWHDTNYRSVVLSKQLTGNLAP